MMFDILIITIVALLAIAFAAIVGTQAVAGLLKSEASSLAQSADKLRPVEPDETSKNYIERGLQCRRCHGALVPMAQPCDCPACRQAVDDLLNQIAALKP